MNDWIEHDGSDIPVPGDTLVYVKFRDGVNSPRAEKANIWYWRHEECDYTDIIAYKVVKS